MGTHFATRFFAIGGMGRVLLRLCRDRRADECRDRLDESADERCFVRRTGVSGLSALPVGRWIDRHGGQRLMTIGDIVGAGALLLWSQVTALWQLYAVWILIGAVCSMTLYEAAFAVTAHLVPGGFAAPLPPSPW